MPWLRLWCVRFFFFQGEDGIRDIGVTGVQTCALPIYLVGAYLARKAATLLALIDAELVRLEGDPRAALLSVVDAVERDVTRAGFRGCPFNNVSSEYDDPHHPARSAAADYKFELYARLERLAEQVVPGRGEDLAAHIHLIIDGMYLSGGLLGPDGPAAHGRRLAERLVDVALREP